MKIPKYRSSARRSRVPQPEILNAPELMARLDLADLESLERYLDDHKIRYHKDFNGNLFCNGRDLGRSDAT